MKKKLKKEYVDKLTQLGLKWSVHERKYIDDAHHLAPVKSRCVTAADDALGKEKGQIPSTIAVPAKKNDSNAVKPTEVAATVGIEQKTDRTSEKGSAKPTQTVSVQFNFESF